MNEWVEVIGVGVIIAAIALAPQEPPTPLQIQPSVSTLTSIPLTRITAYNATEAQTDAEPWLSACGITFEGQLAVSRDLLNHVVPCGTSIIIMTDGGDIIRGVVNDTMNVRYKNSADVMLNNLQDAIVFGVQSGHIILN